jgi:hypothetical protein
MSSGTHTRQLKSSFIRFSSFFSKTNTHVHPVCGVWWRRHVENSIYYSPFSAKPPRSGTILHSVRSLPEAGLFSIQCAASLEHSGTPVAQR